MNYEERRDMLEELDEHCDNQLTCEDCVFADDSCVFDEYSDEELKNAFSRIGVTSDAPIDNVNHPNHYCRDGAMETIDEMITLFGIEDVMAFCKCNAWKYRARAMYKNGEEDLKKSDWYIKKYDELHLRVMYSGK